MLSLSQSRHSLQVAGVLLTLALVLGFAVAPARAQSPKDDSSSSTYTWVVNPQSGTAPLEVTALLSGSSCVNSRAYTIVWGDGQTTAVQISSGTDCPTTATYKHNYTKAGTYTVNITQSGNISVLSQTVTVTDASNTPATYTFTVEEDADNSLKVTSEFVLVGGCSNQQAYTIAWGDGQTTVVQVQSGNDCPAYITKAHTYSQGGTYTVKITLSDGRSSSRNITVVGSDTDTVSVDTNLRISPTSGEAPLRVSASWSALRSCQSYSLDWGDGSAVERYTRSSDLPNCTGTQADTVTNSHTYSGAGRYTVKLTANKISSTATVRVAEAEGIPNADEEDKDKIEELRALVNSLLKLLQERGQTPVVSSVCQGFTRNLSTGSDDQSTDGEVSRLQIYLKNTGHFTYPEITGYYGPATEQAVQRWQSSRGLVRSGSPATTGYGAFGPKSRAAICSN